MAALICCLSSLFFVIPSLTVPSSTLKRLHCNRPSIAQRDARRHLLWMRHPERSRSPGGARDLARSAHTEPRGTVSPPITWPLFSPLPPPTPAALPWWPGPNSYACCSLDAVWSWWCSDSEPFASCIIGGFGTPALIS